MGSTNPLDSVTPESPPPPSLSTPVHFSMPTAVKEGPEAPDQRSISGGGEAEEVLAQSTVSGGDAGGDLQAEEEEGLAATASEMVRRLEIAVGNISKTYQ
ncbi:hypothetical protein ElyMa_005491200 [Elysia marginata]|uniref:Uncharacterized protein n=1 Tax=Elysia marginata TaxID=1093978 RepID=A0AAV4ETQ4_9GAST|nr:hypothetical protein ElyMa_005491200 [Elysia marginata]